MIMIKKKKHFYLWKNMSKLQKKSNRIAFQMCKRKTLMQVLFHLYDAKFLLRPTPNERSSIKRRKTFEEIDSFSKF